MNRMKPVFILVASMVLAPVFIHAQTDSTARQLRSVKASIAGKVINAKTGDSLVGASVLFPDLKIGGATNSQGVFKLQNIPQGTYLLEVSHLGYASVLETITIK